MEIFFLKMQSYDKQITDGKINCSRIKIHIWNTFPSFELKFYSDQNRSTAYPDSKVHGAGIGPIWGQQDPGGPHVGPMNFAIWVFVILCLKSLEDQPFVQHFVLTSSKVHQ